MSRCINSLLKQTYQDIEVILVNDGSRDGTLDCMNRFSQKDQRVKVVDLGCNRGPDYARFSGIQFAKGEFIAFADADDWYAENGIETLYETSIKTKADIVEGSLTRTIGKTGIIKRIYHNKEQEISTPELFDKYFISFFGINLLSVTLCGKLFRRALFDIAELKPTDFKMGEDLILNMRLFPYVKKYVSIPTPVYYYRIGGMTSHYNTSFYPDLKAQYYIKLDTIQQYNYLKAVRPTKVEMCNIVCSQVKQMLLYRRRDEDILSFIQKEIDSGFIDEITDNISYPSATLLAGKDRESIVASLRQGIWKKRFRKSLYSIFFR
jgi:glycosyltransferase involved in cell wall biosynthesis